MPSTQRLTAAGNQLLAGLPGKTRLALLDGCETVDLATGEILCEPGERYRHVHFPLAGCLSAVAFVTGHPPLAISLIGNEGMDGAMLALGVQRVPQRVVIQAPGTALRLSAEQFSKAVLDHASLSRTVYRYLSIVFEQLIQTAACNRFHDVEARLAYRLLMIHDRAQSDHFHLTHQFLADMLGVLRSAVTIAAGALQQRGLIHYSRGDISILDRKGLEDRSCECYAIAGGATTN